MHDIKEVVVQRASHRLAEIIQVQMVTPSYPDTFEVEMDGKRFKSFEDAKQHAVQMLSEWILTHTWATLPSKWFTVVPLS